MKSRLKGLMCAGHMFKTVAKRLGLSHDQLRDLIRETFG